MNGVHDMGGTHGMRPIRHEEKEPVFHQPWESRVFAINRALGPWRKWNIDAGRHAIELLPLVTFGHTRLPRYVRGRVGTIDRLHGIFVFPDTNPHFLGGQPQHLYSVRFAARELWGDQASARDSVYIDMWDSYLEHS